VAKGQSNKAKGNGRLTEEEFTLRGIETLRKGAYRGIHCRFSGFNEAFRTYYGDGADPVGSTNRLAKAGKITVRPCRGGVMLYKPGEAPVAEVAGSAALAAMGIS